jgi:hypothetical protein
VSRILLCRTLVSRLGPTPTRREDLEFFRDVEEALGCCEVASFFALASACTCAFIRPASAFELRLSAFLFTKRKEPREECLRAILEASVSSFHERESVLDEWRGL